MPRFRLDGTNESKFNLKISIMSLRDLLESGANVSVTVTLDAKFVDQRDDAILFESSSIAGTYDYDPLNETESDAKAKALVLGVRKLVDNTISGW